MIYSSLTENRLLSGAFFILQIIIGTYLTMMFNNVDFETYFKNYPDANGYFGKYGDSYVSPELQTAMNEINEAYHTICKSRRFIAELRRIRKEFQGRPTPISHLERLSNKLGNVQLYVKREDLNHSGAHKLNHCMGEVLLAKCMGKKKVIAETGAGQHGVALATAAAYFELSRMEGIIPAIESAHAVAYGMKLAKTMGRGSVLINLSGRGDKDMDYVIERYGIR